MSRLGGLALLLVVIFLGGRTDGHVAVAGDEHIPALIFPFPEGQAWRITCGYADGDGCQHADTQYTRYALDFQHSDGPGATAGKRIVAAAGGTVVIAGWGGASSYGWYVQIDHGDGYATLYAHMQQAPDVAVDQHVTQGQTLGRVGCTGSCTGPHVHFALFHDGTSIVPEPICGESGFNDGQRHTACQAANTTLRVASPGDANCDGRPNAIDGAVVLQFSAHLIPFFGCMDAADVNWDASIDPLDASLIAQFSAGFVTTLLHGAWSSGAPMPTARTEVTSAQVNGIIYVIGGFRAADGNSDVVEAYDTTNNTWSTKAPLPVRVDHAGAAAVNGMVYVFGGYTSGSASTAVYAYNPMTNQWTSRAGMPFARAAAATVALDGIVYVLGGVGPQPTVPLAYSPTADAWVQLAPMSAAREHLTASAVAGRIYVIGGRQNITENVDAAAAYNPDTNSWQPLAALPTARGGLASGPIDGLVHVVGGEDLSPGGSTFPQHEVYNPATNGWRLAPPLPTPRHGLTAQVVNGKLYVIGGGPTPNLSVSNAMEIFDLSTSSTTALVD